MKFHVLNTATALLLVALITGACSDDDSGNTPTPTPGIERSGSMLRVPAKGKTLLMGSAVGNDDERPTHTVSFTADFWMDSTEITIAQYDQVMRAAYPGYAAPSWLSTYGNDPRTAVYRVDWGDAVLFCNARSKAASLDTVYSYSAIDGIPGNGCILQNVQAKLASNGYRLPTEAEWEFACRAGTSTEFPWGTTWPGYPASSNDSTEVAMYAVWAGNSWNLSSDNPAFGIHTVASRMPNTFGLYDMIGNVWEWCHDWYDANYYAGSPTTDPAGPAEGQWHVLRGGSWGNDAKQLRAANREFVVPDYLFNFIGFRTVRSAR